MAGRRRKNQYPAPLYRYHAAAKHIYTRELLITSWNMDRSRPRGLIVDSCVAEVTQRYENGQIICAAYPILYSKENLQASRWETQRKRIDQGLQGDASCNFDSLPRKKKSTSVKAGVWMWVYNNILFLLKGFLPASFVRNQIHSVRYIIRLTCKSGRTYNSILSCADNNGTDSKLVSCRPRSSHYLDRSSGRWTGTNSGTSMMHEAS
jgi:hypothetical protein